MVAFHTVSPAMSLLVCPANDIEFLFMRIKPVKHVKSLSPRQEIAGVPVVPSLSLGYPKSETLETMRNGSWESSHEVILLFVFVFALLNGVLCSPDCSFAAVDSVLSNEESQIKQIETDLSREKEQYLKFDFKEKDLLGQLADIEDAVSEKSKLLKELRNKIRQNRDELDSMQKKLNQHESLLEGIEKRLSRRLVALYKYARRGYVQILATSGDLDELRKRMKYLRVIVNEDQMILQAMVDEKRKCHEAYRLIKEKLTIINNMEKAETARLTSMKSDIERKVILLATIHREKEFYGTAVKELQSAARNLQEKILSLEKDPPKKKPLPTGFGDVKGNLVLPFEGEIIKGDRILGGEIVRARKGIYIKGPLGARIRAVFPGRVDFSGRLKGYGEVIVVNHGSRFFTISAHLLERNKDEGELVDEGEMIGLLGQSGSLMGPMLYFEIRRAGVNLDPLDWLKVH